MAEAQALRLKREKHADWKPLIERAKSLRNNSDRAYVLTYIASCMHSGFATERLQLLEEAKLTCDTIPSIYDRVERLRVVASVARDVDLALARSLVTNAMQMVNSEHTEDADAESRRLVDFAYQIDPEFATSLASSLDSDHARRLARDRIDYQKLKSRISDNSDWAEGSEERNGKEYSRVAWELLGQLNAGRIESHDVTATGRFVGLSGGLSLKDSFPILSWVIQNAIVRRSRSDEAKRFLREMFDSTISASELAAAIIARTTGKSINLGPRPAADRQIVAADERSTAIERITEWLASSANEYLTICDPYFGPKDLEILKLVLSTAPRIDVTILTSRRQQDQEKVSWPWDEYFLRYWHDNFSDEKPPKTEIVVVGGKNGELPIHDRWWLTKGGGLRFGGSFGGVGKSRDSEISVLTAAEAEERLQRTNSYLSRQTREHLGERITFNSFEL